MGLAALISTGHAVYGRADERMTEPDLGVDVKESVDLGCGGRLVNRDAELLRRAPQQAGLADWLDRCHK